MAKRTVKKRRRYAELKLIDESRNPEKYEGGGIVSKPGVSGTPLMR